jgi:alkanesulfonate monooxygenase SsuD/methylene tetrahydromethanopterin reductase-like flavin-dependent oxidoreductase (luciferase family)
MAEVTERVQFGCLVAATGYHNPNMLADRARSLDHFSNGRFILGIGSGWNQRDYEEYGFEFGTAASRLKDLDRDMKIIMDRLEKLNPPPIQNPLPILIGGGGEKVTLRIVAEYATIWNGQEEPEVMRHKNQVLDEYYDAGVTHFLTASAGPDYDLTDLHKLLSWRDARNG